MERRNKFYLLSAISAAALFLSSTVQASNVEKNTAQMQALDKISGQIKLIEVPVNGEVKFGSFSVVVRKCLTASQDETPEDYAFVDVADTNRDGKLFNIFKGWMISSSPSLNSIEHPIYDVFLKKCIDKKTSQSLLSEEQLKKRDNLEKIKVGDLSKEAKIAIEVQEQQEKAEAEAKIEEEKLAQQRAEEEEEQNRQKALEKEIQVQQEQQQIEEIVSGEGGPVSLLNLGNQNPDTTEDTAPQKLVEPSIIEEKQSEENLSAEAHDAGIDGLVIIDDTHHETIEQDLNLPDDISEVIPENLNKDQ